MIVLTTSSNEQKLLRGILSSIGFWSFGSPQTLSARGVQVIVGLIVFTLIPYYPNSKPITLVRESTAPLDAQ